MRTIVNGPVSNSDLEMADLFGIVPTRFVINDQCIPPSGLPIDEFPVDRRQGVFGKAARDYTLCQNADALILVERDDHLLGVAKQYGLRVYRCCS
jgi:hypothetical protein